MIAFQTHPSFSQENFMIFLGSDTNKMVQLKPQLKEYFFCYIFTFQTGLKLPLILSQLLNIVYPIKLPIEQRLKQYTLSLFIVLKDMIQYSAILDRDTRIYSSYITWLQCSNRQPTFKKKKKKTVILQIQNGCFLQ